MKRVILALFVLFLNINIAFCADFTTFKLENGHTFIIKPIHTNPIVTIDTWVKTGSINEDDKNNGIAHFLEHMFFKGSKNYQAGEFDRILESKGAVINAATSKDYTHFYITIPSKDFELALKMHEDMLLNPLFPRHELEKERKVVIEEISRGLDNPQNILYKNFNSGFYKTHPYRYDVIGKKEIIEKVTQEEMFDFYNKWYVPQNMTTVIVGDIDEKKIIDLLKSTFNKKISDKYYPRTYKVDNSPKTPIVINKELDVQTGYYILGFKGTKPTNNDSYALDVLSVILGDGRSSILYQNVKEQKQLANSITSRNSSSKDDGLFLIYATFDKEKLNKLDASIKNEIENIKKINVSNEILNRAKKIIEKDVFYSRESVSNIANELGYISVVTNDLSLYSNYIDDIKKVTSNDIKRVANKYLDLNKSVTSIIVPKDSCKNEHPVSNIKNKNDKNIQAKLIKKVDTVSKYELPNGSILLINQNTSNDIVAIQIMDAGGVFTEQIPGVGNILANSLMKGTKNYNYLELSQIMEENGITILPSITSDTFTISVQTTKNELNKTFELLDEVINNPKFDIFEIEKIKRELLTSIKTQRDTPSSVMFEEFKNAIWKNTPYNNTGKVLEKTLNKISTNDVINYYNKLFYPKNLVISVNGNVDEKTCIDYFTKLFENKKGEKINLKNYNNIFARPIQKTCINTKKDTNTSWIAIGWKTDGVTNQKDWATLQVINSILGNGMSSRLFVNLRDAQGLAYQIGSTYLANLNSGLFAVYIGTKPQTLEHSKNELLREVEKIKTEFVLDKELNEAKEKIIGNYIISLETNGKKAATLAWFETSGRSFEFDKKYVELINSVCAKDIILIANKYFNDNMVISIVGK